MMEGGEDDGEQQQQEEVIEYRTDCDKPRTFLPGLVALESVRAVVSSPDDIASALDQISSNLHDEKSRCDMVQHLPAVSKILLERPNGHDFIASHVIPLLLKLLIEDRPPGQVFRLAEMNLLRMLEENIISNDVMVKIVWPAIESKLDGSSDIDTTVGFIHLMSKLARWFGSEQTERLIFPVLVRLSSSPQFPVRKACASLYGSFCAVVSTQTTETQLVPVFLKLCRDEEWTVRRACTDVCMSVSCAVSVETRIRRLVPVFSQLLSDKTRWVTLSAFHSLGSFITTFAFPSITNLGYNPDGNVVLQYPGFEFSHSNAANVKKENMAKSFEEGAGWLYDDSGFGGLSVMCSLSNNNSDRTEIDDEEDSEGENYDEDHEENNLKTEEFDAQNNPTYSTGFDNCENFNNFQFWREPLPEIDLDLNCNAKAVGRRKSKRRPRNGGMFGSMCDDIADQISAMDLNARPMINHADKQMTNRAQTDGSCGDDRSDYGEEIVPRELIELFVSMSDPVPPDADYDLALNCAYNLPAVALTIGPQNWKLLKPAYETLAADRQWKVRRTVASSIHELAVIVGEDVATQDLVPVFSGFIKDLDEVRIAALKHLAHFLKVLRPAGRNSFLPRLTEFLVTDYEWNWRFRRELAEQLLQVLGLFSPPDTCHHLSPIIMALLLDRVSDVRKSALHLVTELVSHVSIDVTLLRSLLAELAEQFAHSPRWNRRQTFALFCARLVSEAVLSGEMFAKDVLPHLLDLSWDRVPNVRLTVARALAQDVLAQPYFANESGPHYDMVTAVLKRLQTDKDRDVRYFASQLPPGVMDTPFFQTDLTEEENDVDYIEEMDTEDHCNQTFPTTEKRLKRS